MSSIERWGADEHPNASHYLPVDPQTLGRLRILRVGDVELQLDGHRLLVRGTRFTCRTRSSSFCGS